MNEDQISHLVQLRDVGQATGGRELLELYALATIPERGIDALEGDPYCLGLTVHEHQAPFGIKWVARWLNPKMRQPSFIWHGKSFRTTGDHDGIGWNRLNIWGSCAFPFRTTMGLSIIDKEPCIQLHYCKSTNPWFLRNGYDELREVKSGVFFGPVFSKTGKIRCWFGVDTNHQVRFPELQGPEIPGEDKNRV